MGDLIEDRVVVVGEVVAFLTVYVPDEIVGVQGDGQGQAAHVCRAGAGHADDLLLVYRGEHGHVVRVVAQWLAEDHHAGTVGPAIYTGERGWQQ